MKILLPSELVEAGWTQNAFARKPYGNGDKGVATGIGDPEATRFCAIGAIQRWAWTLGKSELAQPVLESVFRELYDRGFNTIESFNDAPKTTKEQVVDVLRRAENRLELGVVTRQALDTANR